MTNQSSEPREIGAVPPLFAAIPPTLFGPLASLNAPLYWAALARFYQYEFEEGTTALVRPTAVELAEWVIRASPLWSVARERLLTELGEESNQAGAEAPFYDQDVAERELHSLAKRIVDRLESAGWFHFEYQSRLGEVLNFYPYAARILDPLLRIARDEQPVLQSYAIGILQALRTDTIGTRPGYAIREAKEKTAEFTRELKVLNRNIYIATRRLVDDARTASGVLEELLSRYQRRVMGSFHRLKTIDNPFRHRGEILLRLDDIETNETLLDKAARWYGEQFELDGASAYANVRDTIHTIRLQIERLPSLLNDIDIRNARFSGSARNRLTYLLSKNRHIDGQLQGLIDALATGKVEALPFDIYRARFLAEDFLYVPRERAAVIGPTPLGEPIVLNPAAMRERARRILAQPFGRRAIARYVLAALGPRGRMPATQLPVANDDDYVRYICIVTYGIRPDAPYRFVPVACTAPSCTGAACPSCHVPLGPYHLPAGTIERSSQPTTHV